MIPTELLLAAYASGWFPMADENGSIAWYSPDPRAIIPLDRLHVPARLQRLIRQGAFRVQIDTAFPRVIRACADAERDRDDPGTWISEEIIESYCALHAAGYAHSVETWQGDRLVGGLYGVLVGSVFCGESMFHRRTDASKVALVELCARLLDAGVRLVDVQEETPHLASLGQVLVRRADYVGVLRALRDTPVHLAPDRRPVARLAARPGQ